MFQLNFYRLINDISIPDEVYTLKGVSINIVIPETKFSPQLDDENELFLVNVKIKDVDDVY